MPDDDYISFSVLVLPKPLEVRLYQETMVKIARDHPEFELQLPSYETGIGRALATPDSIHSSTTRPTSLVVVSSAFTYNGDSVFVPVKLITESSARVQTAYFSSGAPPGAVLWEVRK
jgi:hypothetical protein